MRILVVDDSGVMRAMIRRVLGLSGVPIQELFEAGDGAEALRLLEAHDIDVLFTDINMPVMTGTELLRALASSARYSALRRVIISTDGSASRREEAAALNVRTYLEKPFSPEVIRDVLNEIA
jgi:two-component system chemotaxis response regulator CheY